MPKVPNRARNVTLFDVARVAGVSHQTVSRVLNARPGVRETTRIRVQQAMEQLSYRPNVAARVMSTRRSRNLGLITEGSADYGPSSTVIAFTKAAREAKYTVTIATPIDADPVSLRASADLLLSHQVEAIVIVAPTLGILDGIADVQSNTPTLVVEASGRTQLPTVSIDQFAGAEAATTHLISAGHRDILHVAGPTDSIDAIERRRAWATTMVTHGLVCPPVLTGDWSPESGYRLCEEAIVSGRVFSAIFSGNDQMALGCISALRVHGLSVPGDVSIVGFDDLPEAGYFSPGLTTMRQDFTQLGADIMARLLTMLRGESAPPQVRRIPTLILRSSTRGRAEG